MSILALPIFLLLQGLPIQTGTVSGVLRDSLGKPAPGIRISVTARSSDSDVPPLEGIATTDQDGRFILEGIRPGRYVVAAGWVDLPTYYPGTQNVTEASILTIESGVKVVAIDFTIKDTSFGANLPPQGWVRMAAYQDIVWPVGTPEPLPRILLNGTWYELVSIETIPTAQLIGHARKSFGELWRKRFDEDMVEILRAMGRPSSGTVSLGVRDLVTGEPLTRSSPMNSDNRALLMRAKNARGPQ